MSPRAATLGCGWLIAAHRRKATGPPKGSGTRDTEALQLVKASPGITIPESAAKMGIKQNYLYRVLPASAGRRTGDQVRPRLASHPQAL